VGEGRQETTVTDQTETVDLASTYIAVGADRAAAYTTAIAGLDGRLDRATRPNDIGIELNCWVHKLKTEAQVDDRVIEWTRICPRLPTGPAQPSSVCEDFAVNEEQLYGLARTADEVDAANNQLHFIAHVKAEVLELQTSFPGNDRDQFVVDALVRLLRDVKKAQRELDAMAQSSERGGIPRHYRAIREWIARRAADPKSLYAPCS